MYNRLMPLPPGIRHSSESESLQEVKKRLDSEVRIKRTHLKLKQQSFKLVVVKAGGHSFVLNQQETTDEDLKEMQLYVGIQSFGAIAENKSLTANALLAKLEKDYSTENLSDAKEGYGEKTLKVKMGESTLSAYKAGELKVSKRSKQTKEERQRREVEKQVPRQRKFWPCNQSEDLEKISSSEYIDEASSLSCDAGSTVSVKKRRQNLASRGFLSKS